MTWKLLNQVFKSRINPRLIQTSATKLISAPPEKIDFFHLLDQPKQFEVNSKKMSQKFRQLQSEFHPDRYSQKSPEELEHAENWSALVNQAYSTLLNPMDRALYLLECFNDPLLEGEQPKLDTEFLSEIMELNEDLDEISSDKDIEEFSAKIKENLQDLHGKLSEKFGENSVSEAKIITMKISVIGGGISGLTSAFYCSKLPNVTSIKVYENSNRLGGWVQSTIQNDFTFEHGPRTIRPAGPQGANTLELVEELGLESKLKPIKHGHPATVNRMVYVDGKLHKLPSSLKSIFTPRPPFSKPLILAGIKEFFTPQKQIQDESIFDFVARRFGPDVAQYAIDPMVRGICAGDARSISAKSFVAGPMFNLEQNYGSVFRGMLKRKLRGESPKIVPSTSELVKRVRAEKWNVWSLEGGLETLIQSLSSKLQKDGIDIILDHQIQDENIDPKLGKMSNSDFTIWSTPACETAKYVPETLKSSLNSIPYVDVAVINFLFSNGSLIQDPGFGFLVPSNQSDVPILGVIFDTCSFPQHNQTIFTVMMGGSWFQKLFGNDPKPSDLETIALGNLRKIMKFQDEPSQIITKIHRNAIAQYTVGHWDRVRKLRQMAQDLPLAFVGSSYDGVGLNDAIMSSKIQIEKLIK